MTTVLVALMPPFLFGIYNTDLIISTGDAQKILSKQHNIDLIKKGRILIIYHHVD